MQLALGKEFRPCKDNCGTYIMLVLAPAQPGKKAGAWVPVEIVGFDEQTGQRIIEIHHPNCVNTRVPGNRDPERSHRIAVNEDQPEVPEGQQQFRFRPTIEG